MIHVASMGMMNVTDSVLRFHLFRRKYCVFFCAPKGKNYFWYSVFGVSVFDSWFSGNTVEQYVVFISRVAYCRMPHA